MKIEGTNTVTGGTGHQPRRGRGQPAFCTRAAITDPDNITQARGTRRPPNAVGNFSYPAMNWTAGPSGAIEFREDPITALGPNVGGLVVNALSAAPCLCSSAAARGR